MVFINDKKFACESCIKGHRSSSCRHNDRPLFEIKKKGRPVSQCQKCRDLRQTKRIHSKCTCSTANEEETRPPIINKSKRFVPITPSLPNGLKDALKKSNETPSEPADPRQRVDTLLNPCLCKDVWNCRCRPAVSSEADIAQSDLDPDCSGLAALARAATLQTYQVMAPRSALENISAIPSGSKQPRERSNSPLQRSPSSTKRRRHSVYLSSTQVPTLPPIGPSSSLLDAEVSPPSPLPALPVFPTPHPSVHVMHSMTDCTCGYRCQCPGCIQHRGTQHASEDHADCADGCGTCVDYEGGIELPPTSSIAGPSTSSLPSSSIMDIFLARAAALPPPPARPGASTGTLGLDPTNVVVYPPSLFAASADQSLSKEEQERRRMAFGLVVNLPRLECCGGSCKCPPDACGCAEACEGGCVDHTHGHGLVRGTSAIRSDGPVASGNGGILTIDEEEEEIPLRSCCAGKALETHS